MKFEHECAPVGPCSICLQDRIDILTAALQKIVDDKDGDVDPYQIAEEALTHG